ncbi:MAG: phosphoethanolamine transferase [Marinilabiliaceae bacterium]|nr:phosphoethanolamine transferase [Marinilabiliaceae bacterium]
MKKKILNRIIIISFLILALSPIIAEIILNYHGFIYSCAFLISRGALLLFLFILLSIIFNSRVSAYILGVLVFLTIPVELVHLFMFKEFVTRQGMIAIIQTNINEGLSFLRGYEWFAILYLIVTILYFVFFKKLSLNFSFFKSLNIKLNPKIINIFVLLSLIIVTTIFLYIQIKVSTDTSTGKTTGFFVRKEVVKKYPFNMPFRSYEMLAYNKLQKKYQQLIKDFQFNAKQTNDFDEEQIYVLVIGESARAGNYQLFGYERETTPLLMNIQNIIAFSDFYANSNTTNSAIPILLTRALSTDFELSNKEKSIVTLFKEAGFETYWICNQEIFKGYSADRFLQEVDNFYFKVGEGTDEVVLQVLDDILKNNDSKKKFIVINLFGNHYGLNFTPEKYHLFSPNLEGNKIVNRSVKNRELFINSYNNSVLFQDFILSEIINRVNSNNAISYVYFTSDHGESLFDEPDFFYGHGSSKITIEQIYIPAFVWYSTLYEKYNINMINNLNTNRDKKFSNDNTFYTLSQLSSINFDNFNAHYSIADSLFQEPAKRYAVIDYVVVPAEFD